MKIHQIISKRIWSFRLKKAKSFQALPWRKIHESGGRHLIFAETEKICIWKYSNIKIQLSSKDLGSLFGIFDYGYSTMLKISNFPATLILSKINLGWFQKLKTAVLLILKAMNIDFWKNSTLKNVKVPKNLKSRATQMVKMAVFGASRWPKLISRKIWVAEKLLKHCV